MKSDKVDDIFDDFEHKVADKKSISEKPQREPSEEEILKRKYREAEENLKDKYKKEKETLKESKRKELVKHGKTPNSPANIERIGYIGVILVLIVYVGIDFSFYHGEKSSSELQPITAKVVEEEIDVGLEENVTEEATEPVEEKVEEPEEAVVVEEELNLSGKITLTMDKVYTEVADEDSDLGYITKVVFTIENDKDKVLSPVVHVFAYDDELHESWVTRSRGEYTWPAGISPGDAHTGTISLAPKTFRNLDLEKIVRIEFNDTEDGFISAKSKTVLIS